MTIRPPVNNPLLDDGATGPGVTVTLPTLGSFYDPTVLDPNINVMEAPVRPFSVWQELTWRDPYAIMSGDAFIQFMNVCAPWVLDPLSLCQIDAEVIMMAARDASYGPIINVPVKCTNPAHHDDGAGNQVPVCQIETKCQIDLRQVIARYAPIHAPEEWRVTLKNGQRVNLRPVIHQDMVETFKYQFELLKMTRQIEMKIKAGEEIGTEQYISFRDKGLMVTKGVRLKQYTSSIRSVTTVSGQTITDRKMIEQWLNAIPAPEVGRIDERIEALTKPMLHLMQIDYSCPNCGHGMGKISVLDDPTAFFGPGSAN